LVAAKAFRAPDPAHGTLPTGSLEAVRNSPHLTTRGQAVAASGGALALGAFLSGAIELYGLAVAFLVLVTFAWVRLRAASWNVVVTRTVIPARFSSGANSRVELVARNPTSRPSPEAEARDPLGDSWRAARFNLASMQPGEVRRTTYQLPPLRRGVYKLGPLSVRVSDPFGLAEAEHRSAGEATLVVYPRFEVLPYGSLSLGDRPSLGRARRARGSEPDSFLLRRYVPGDDLRRVHWPTTARVGELTLRQDEPKVADDRVAVVVDLRTNAALHPAVTDETLETVLESAATACSGWIRSGCEVRLLTSGGYDSGPGSGPNHFAAILDGLAAARPHDPGGVPIRLGLCPGDVPLTIVTTDRCTPGLLADLTGSYPTQADTVVVVASAAQVPAATPGGGYSSDGPLPDGPFPDGKTPDLVRSLAGKCRTLYVPTGSTLGRQLAQGGVAK